MPDDLGARLVRAGLLTRAQLEQALSRTPRPGGALAEALVATALDPDELVSFLVASGYGRPVPASALAAASPEALSVVPSAMAHALWLLPVAIRAGVLQVAMADPSDAHALAEVRRIAQMDVEANIARITDLRRALDRHYPAVGRTSAVVPVAASGASATAVEVELPFEVDVEGEPVVLLRRRASSPAPVDEPEAPLPLVRAKSLTPRPRPSFVRAVDPDDRWDTPPSTPPTEQAPTPTWPARTGRAPLPNPPSAPPGDLGAVLANLRVRNDRDALVELTCEGALTVSRSAIFLALRKGTFRGWAGAGSEATPEAVRNLWIPLRSPSMLREVAESRTTYFGPYGETAADALLRAAIGARGLTVCINPVIVQSHTAGVLVADDPSFGDHGRERLEILAHALGEAFKRVLTTTKTPF